MSATTKWETNGVSKTLWVPLATTFTAAKPGCESTFRYESGVLTAFDPAYGYEIDNTVICQPWAVTSSYEQWRLGADPNKHTTIMIQPVVCPNKWRTATSFAQSGTTSVMCCPSSYKVAAGMFGGQACLSEVSKGVVLTFASPVTDGTTEWSTATTTLTTSSVVAAFAVVGYNIQSASSTATSNSTRIPAIDSSTTSALSSPTGESSATLTTSSNNSTDNGMSAAVKAGIGVGALLAVLGLGALIATFFLFRRRHATGNHLGMSLEDKSSNATDPGPEIDTSPQELHSDNLPSEMIDNGRRSPEMLHGDSIPSEMPDDGRRSPVELDTQRLSR